MLEPPIYDGDCVRCGFPSSVLVVVASTVGGAFTSRGDFTFAEAPGDAIIVFDQDHALFATVNARLVRFIITTNHGSDHDFAGLSEIRFGGAVIPEPSSAEALLGFGAWACALHRRR